MGHEGDWILISNIRPCLVCAAPKKKGKKMDVTKSLVRDPNEVPDAKSPELEVVVTAWRPDKLKDMTYTQFWQLISERQIERVRVLTAETQCSDVSLSERRCVLTPRRDSRPTICQCIMCCA